eukprot:COSAG02_NODE_2127_length_9742_cov_32.510318_1_plen_141_part_00
MYMGGTLGSVHSCSPFSLDFPFPRFSERSLARARAGAAGARGRVDPTMRDGVQLYNQAPGCIALMFPIQSTQSHSLFHHNRQQLPATPLPVHVQATDGSEEDVMCEIKAAASGIHYCGHEDKAAAIMESAINERLATPGS